MGITQTKTKFPKYTTKPSSVINHLIKKQPLFANDIDCVIVDGLLNNKNVQYRFYWNGSKIIGSLFENSIGWSHDNQNVYKTVTHLNTNNIFSNLELLKILDDPQFSMSEVYIKNRIYSSILTNIINNYNHILQTNVAGAILVVNDYLDPNDDDIEIQFFYEEREETIVPRIGMYTNFIKTSITGERLYERNNGKIVSDVYEHDGNFIEFANDISKKLTITNATLLECVWQH